MGHLGSPALSSLLTRQLVNGTMVRVASRISAGETCRILEKAPNAWNVYFPHRTSAALRSHCSAPWSSFQHALARRPYPPSPRSRYAVPLRPPLIAPSPQPQHNLNSP